MSSPSTRNPRVRAGRPAEHGHPQHRRTGLRIFYLFGVTGSGKTDVFIKVAQEVVSRGKGVIYLVPEIALTHQVVRVFKTHFKDRLAVLHSSLTPPRDSPSGRA